MITNDENENMLLKYVKLKYVFVLCNSFLKNCSRGKLWLRKL